ncbi:MAG: GTPase/DUF3482 domain-containing protein [Burkholderiaceae bacterium]
MARTEPLQIAVVGHTNAGKTSLLRTLTRRVDFGEVSDRPGTTRHVESVELRVDGQVAVRFFDTPGLEDAVTLLEHVSAFDAGSRPERIRRFLQGPEAHGAFEQEAKVLRKLLEVDAAFLVIDAREPVLPKFAAEVELLNSCARPLLPVLNFVRDAASREAQWRDMLSAAGLHAVVLFDAAAPFTGAERELYQDLGTLLPSRRGSLRDIVGFLGSEFEARRRAGCTLIAQQIVEAAALRHVATAAEFADPIARQARIETLRHAVSGLAQRGIDALLELHGFREGDAAEAPLPQLGGRWTMDLFNPEAIRQAGVRLGQGAAVGVAIGVAADLAVGGLSLGAGAALGGALGGALAQGFGPLGRQLRNKLRGVHELTVEDSVLFVLADWQLGLLRALEQRGHAARQPIGRVGAGGTETAPGTGSESDSARAANSKALARIVQAAQPARSHPEWAEPRRGDSTERSALIASLGLKLQQVFDKHEG